MAEREDLLRDIGRLQAQARMVSNRTSRPVRLDMLLMVEDLVQRTLVFLGRRERLGLFPVGRRALVFNPLRGFEWAGLAGDRTLNGPASVAEVLDSVPFEQVVEALTHSFNYDLRQKGKQK